MKPKIIFAFASAILLATASAIVMHHLGASITKVVVIAVLVYGGVTFAITALGVAIDELRE